MLQILACLSFVACHPVECVLPTWLETTKSVPAHVTLPLARAEDAGLRSAAPDNVCVMAGPSGSRKRPVNKSRCLDSAAAGGVVWTAFCTSIQDASIRKRCFEVSLESEQRRKGFCNNFF